MGGARQAVDGCGVEGSAGAASAGDDAARARHALCAVGCAATEASQGSGAFGGTVDPQANELELEGCSLTSATCAGMRCGCGSLQPKSRAGCHSDHRDHLSPRVGHLLSRGGPSVGRPGDVCSSNASVEVEVGHDAFQVTLPVEQWTTPELVLTAMSTCSVPLALPDASSLPLNVKVEDPSAPL